MTAENKAGFPAFLRRNGPALLFTAGLFGLMYAVVFHFRLTGMDEGYDYLAHTLWAMGMTGREVLASFYDGSEHLWHICVKGLLAAGVSNMWTAAALVTAAADAAAYFLVFKVWDRLLDGRFPRWLLAMLTAAVFLVSALALPGGDLYVGRGAVNTWHNPTNIMVRPFAAAVFYMTVDIYDRRRFGGGAADFAFEGGFLRQFRRPVYTGAELVLYPLCLLLSAYAKPSFLQFFAPAIFLFLIIDVIRTKGQLLPFCIKLALAFIPAGLVILSQFSGFFGAGGVSAGAAAAGEAAAEAEASGIAVYFIEPSFATAGAFFAALGRKVMQVIWPCAFPLFIFAVGGFRRGDMRLALLGLLAAWLETLFLHETGERASHGNILWGYYLSCWLIWIAAIGQYAALLTEKTRTGRLCLVGGGALLLWHLASGITYVVRVLQTGCYFF